MSNRVNLTLDVTKTGIQNPLIKVRQGDGGFETLRTTVTSNGEPLDLQGWTVTFMGTTAGNHKIVDANVTIVEAPNGIFDYTPSKAWGMDIGEFKIAYFKFVMGDGSASSANFRVNVIEAVDLTQEEAQHYISVIDATIAEVREHLESSLADVSSSVAATSTAASSMAVFVSSKASSAASQADSAASNVSSVASDAVAAVAAASNTYVKKSNELPAVARDFSYLANHMQAYQGTWYNRGERVANAPAGNWTYSVIEVIAGNSETTGVIRTARFASSATYSANVNGGAIQYWALIADDANVVHKSGTETIAGDKTFTSPINGQLSGNAATATKWQTARTLALTGDVTGSVSMDGSSNASISTTGANLVHKSGSETIGGDKAFTGATSMNTLNVSGATTFYTKSINWSTGIMQGNWTLQRIGNWVMAKFDMSADTGTGNTTLALPIGFRPLSTFARELEEGNAGLNKNGTIFVAKSYMGSNAMTFIFPTNDTWTA